MSLSAAGALGATTVVHAGWIATSVHRVLATHSSYRPKHRKLFGNDSIEPRVKGGVPGQAEAFRFGDGTSGDATAITVFVDAHSRARELIAALYANNGSRPGTLVATGTRSRPSAGAWNTVKLPATPVSAGTNYWVAVLGRGGRLYVRDSPNDGCPAPSYVEGGMSSMSQSWNGRRSSGCRPSAYVTGTAASRTLGTFTTNAPGPTTNSPSPTTTSPTSTTPTTGATNPPPVTPPAAPPANTALPTVNGSTTVARTLTTTTGSWTGSPIGYSYQWQDCSGSGASCSNIGGATASSYTLTSTDVSHTIRSVLTATNAGGSTSASSAPTALVGGAGGSGGSSGCFASPGSCGYPDPSAGNVGATSACSSLPPSGSLTASMAGQTIQNLDVTGTITVNAANVTIDNVCVTDNGGGQTGSRAVLLNSGAANALIEHVSVAGANSSNKSIEQAIANDSSSNATVDDAYLYDCGECLWNGPWTVNGSYVITNGMQGTSDHLEDLYFSDSTATFNDDTLLDPSYQNSVIFGDTQWGSGGPCDNHLTLTNSLLAGGGFVIYTCGNSSGVGSSSMNISDNHFARCTTPAITYNSSTGGSACQGSTQEQIGAGADSHGYWPDGGYFGVEAGAYCTGSGQTWSGNVWDDDGATVSCS